MKGSTRNLIIAGAAAVVLGGAVFAVNRIGGSGSSSSAAASTPQIQLISKASDDVTSMKVTNKNGTYTLVPMPVGTIGAVSSASSAAASGVKFTVQELSGVPIDTSVTGSVVQNGFSLAATKNIGKVSNLETYGLTNPQATVNVTFRDGSTFGYKIGNATASDTNSYYMCGEQSDNVYIVSVDPGLLDNANYFVTKEMVSVSSASSDASNEQTVFSKITLTGKNFPKTTVIQMDSSGKPFIVSPSTFLIDSNKVSALEKVLSSLSAQSAVALNPDADVLKKYGFDNPTVKAVYTVNKKDHTLVIGGKSSDGYYAMVDSVNVVYDVSADSVNDLAGQTLFDLRSKLIFLPDSITVKQIEITANGKTDTVNITRTENPASSTQDQKAYTYKVTGTNGAQLNYGTNFTNMYQNLIGLAVYDQSDTMPSGTPVVTVRYSYFDKATTDTLAFYAVDSRHEAAVLNGAPYGLCTKSDVDNVLSTIANFEAGKAIPQP